MSRCEQAGVPRVRVSERRPLYVDTGVVLLLSRPKYLCNWSAGAAGAGSSISVVDARGCFRQRRRGVSEWVGVWVIIGATDGGREGGRHPSAGDGRPPPSD